MMTNAMKRTSQYGDADYCSWYWGLRELHGPGYPLVRGVVRSGLDRPVPNVSVSVEGSSMLPVVTNDSGEFSLQAARGNDMDHRFSNRRSERREGST